MAGQEVAERLVEVFQGFSYLDEEDLNEVLDTLGTDTEFAVEDPHTFEEVGMLTLDAGVLVTINGERYTMTIQPYRGFS